MKKFDVSKNLFLTDLSERVYGYLGDNLYLIMLIMAVLFVFSALVVGLLGRGWIAAWFLVILGLLLGFFPCLRYMIIYSQRTERKAADGETDDGKVQSGKGAAIDEEISPDTEAARWAVEIEAMLARDNLKKKLEKERQEEEERQREEQVLKEAKDRERERLRRLEEQRRKKEQERRRKNEESRARWKKSGSKTVFRTQNFTSKKVGYFDGIRSTDELRRKYRELVKKHHPDNGGTPEMMHEIQQQYRELESFFKSYEKHI